MINKPIFITGCARSGTSLTAGIIQRCGAWGGNVQGASRNNAKGQYENLDIRQHVVKMILRNMNVDPLGQNPLPKIENVWRMINESDKLKKMIIGIITRQGYNGNDIWYFKGAKICLMWPLWHAAFPEAKWVIVRREDYDICSSCLRTPFMKAFNRRGGWQFWIDEHKKRFEEMSEFGLDLFEYWPFKAVEGNFEQTKEMIDFLGLTYNEKEIKEFVTPDLWHFNEEGGV
jgi:hypothetical protein